MTKFEQTLEYLQKNKDHYKEVESISTIAQDIMQETKVSHTIALYAARAFKFYTK